MRAAEKASLVGAALYRISMMTMFAALRLAAFLWVLPSLIMGMDGLNRLGASVFLPLLFCSVLAAPICFIAVEQAMSRRMWVKAAACALIGLMFFSINTLLAVASSAKIKAESFAAQEAKNKAVQEDEETTKARKEKIERLQKKPGRLDVSSAEAAMIGLKSRREWLDTAECDADVRKSDRQVRFCQDYAAAKARYDDSVELENLLAGRSWDGKTWVVPAPVQREVEKSPDAQAEALLTTWSFVRGVLSGSQKEADTKTVGMMVAVMLGLGAELMGTFFPGLFIWLIGLWEGRVMQSVVATTNVAQMSQQVEMENVSATSLATLPLTAAHPAAQAPLTPPLTSAAGAAHSASEAPVEVVPLTPAAHSAAHSAAHPETLPGTCSAMVSGEGAAHAGQPAAHLAAHSAAHAAHCAAHLPVTAPLTPKDEEVARWCRARILHADGGRVPYADGYADYLSWSHTENVAPLSRNQLSTTLRSIAPDLLIKDRKGRAFLKDVALRGAKPTLVAVK